jgi:hypothetical protein
MKMYLSTAEAHCCLALDHHIIYSPHNTMVQLRSFDHNSYYQGYNNPATYKLGHLRQASNNIVAHVKHQEKKQKAITIQ